MINIMMINILMINNLTITCMLRAPHSLDNHSHISQVATLVQLDTLWWRVSIGHVDRHHDHDHDHHHDPQQDSYHLLATLAHSGEERCNDDLKITSVDKSNHTPCVSPQEKFHRKFQLGRSDESRLLRPPPPALLSLVKRNMFLNRIDI